jgi:hypothetical protein
MSMGRSSFKEKNKKIQACDQTFPVGFSSYFEQCVKMLWQIYDFYKSF